MNSLHGPVGPWRRVLITPAILDGQPWSAKAIRNVSLRGHCRQLGRTFRSPASRLAPVRTACRRLFVVLESRSRVLLELHPTQLPVVTIAIRMAAYRAQWQREPEDWWPLVDATAREQWASLLRHLFQRYPVPVSFDEVWMLRGSLKHLERDFYCAAGAGHSVRIVTGFPESVSHRVLHLALTECTEPTFTQAVWRAQLKVIGASECLAKEVMASRVVRELTHHEFWSRLAERFAAGSDDDARDFGLVADALAMITAEHGPSRSRQLLREPLAALRQHCHRWWTVLLQANESCFDSRDLSVPSVRARLRAIATTVWSPLLPHPWSVRHREGHMCVEWRMVELCSQGALIDEGRTMRHCIANYTASCKDGRNAIFSLRLRLLHLKPVYESRFVTVQVAVRTRRVVEIRGRWNEKPDEDKMIYVRDWAEANALRLGA